MEINEETQAYLDIVDDRPFAYTLSLIGGKWKMHILFLIYHTKVIRYGQLKRRLGSITHKTLTDHLKILENDGLISRTEYPVIPPKVEYRLTERGLSLMPILEEMCHWGYEHIPPEIHNKP